MATVEGMPPADEMASQRSPTFTNPDLLLPHPARPAPSPPLSPYRHPHRVSDYGQKSTKTSAGEDDGLGVEPIQLARRAASPLMLRPALPGAWQTEEDLPTVQSIRNKTGPPIHSSPTTLDDFHTFRQASPKLLADEEEEDPWAGFDSEIADGGIMSPSGTATPQMAPAFSAPSTAEPQFKFPFNTERSQCNEDEEDLTSHAAMSLRAETILANAKKRLLVSLSVYLTEEGAPDINLGNGR